MAAPMLRHGLMHFRRFCPNIPQYMNKGLSTTTLMSGKYNVRRKNTQNRHGQSPNSSGESKYGRLTENSYEQGYSHLEGSKSFESPVNNTKDVSERFFIPPHIHYTQLKGSDANFGPVVMLAKNRKLREKQQLFLLEGTTHILDAINAGVKVSSVFFTRGELLEHFPLDMMVADGTQLYKVKMGHLQLWSDLVQASGIMAVCQTPRPGVALQPLPDPLPLTLICDNIRDAGNLGLLLRSAAAAGCCQVILTAGCVDPWEPKVLRSAAGAHYQLSLLSRIGWHILANYLQSDSCIYVTDGTAHLDMPDDFDRKTKRRMQSYESPEMDNMEETSEDRLMVDETYLDKDHVANYTNAPLPVIDYFTPEYTQHHTVVIVSGDTLGMSAQVKKLVYDRHGDALRIPISADMRGVNTAISGSLVLFEVKRQHMMHNTHASS